MGLWVLIVVSLCAFAGGAVTPFSPPSFPLAVKSPYLSAWLPQGTGTALNDAWATFWTGQILGWVGFVKVDGVAYSFLGIPDVAGATFTKATQKSAKFTATQSIFVMSAGPVDLTINFLSPVEPKDLVKQSLPFAYMSISAAPSDGKTHSVQVYSDISAEWVSGDTNLAATWSTTNETAVTHEVKLQNQTQYSEINDQTQYGSAYYSTLTASGATYQSGEDVAVRAQFLNNGKLTNGVDSNFRVISDHWPVFALAHDLGSISTSTTPVVVSVGRVRDPSVQYIIAGGALQDRSSYFFSQFSSPLDAIISFLQDHSGAQDRADVFDSQLNSDASLISQDYADIVALSVRQAFGATELTISKNSDGSWNTNDVLMFLKEISSDGNTNTVDVIFPTWPLLVYTNPVLGKYLLDGLLQYQQTGQYPNKFAAHDLGSTYPKAIGHLDGNDEAMPVVQSGNMLIMALSYALMSGDTSQLSKYSALFDQWTQFLIEDSLIPAHQLSTDDFAGSLENQTNLAIKGIIGIRAMASIADMTGNTAKGDNYTAIASSYVTQWQKLATAPTGDHLTLSYGNATR
ncbi:DUF1793-domain-containing protein [Mycena floridula]|nr:DUF1793-domain-containing protein [Mycena floridula]